MLAYIAFDCGLKFLQSRLRFDSRDRALVWRTTGGKHRFLIGDCDALIDDDVDAFRAAAIAGLAHARKLTLESLEAEHALLSKRMRDAPAGSDAFALWQEMGIGDAFQVPDLDAAEVASLRFRRTPTFT